MKLLQRYKYGTELTDTEINEFAQMVAEGKYKVKEIKEYFGLTDYEYKCYIDIAKEIISSYKEARYV